MGSISGDVDGGRWKSEHPRTYWRVDVRLHSPLTLHTPNVPLMSIDVLLSRIGSEGQMCGVGRPVSDANPCNLTHRGKLTTAGFHVIVKAHESGRA